MSNQSNSGGELPHAEKRVLLLTAVRRSNPRLRDSNPECHCAGRKVDSSIKQKLKSNCKRHVSSFAVPPIIRCNLPADTSIYIPESLNEIEECTDQVLLEKMHHGLEKEVSENEDKVQKMSAVENFSLENRAEELDGLIEKWLTATREALIKMYELQTDTEDFSSILEQFNIDCDLIRYNPDTESFY